MEKYFLILALAFGTCAAIGAETPTASSALPATKSPADNDHDALWALYRTEPPAGVEYPSRAHFRFFDAKMREFSAAARAFGEKYPADPRRYDGYVQSSFTRPWFITDFKPEFDTAPNQKNLIVDQPALVAYRSTQAELLTEVIEAPDAGVRQRGGAFFALIADARGAAMDAGRAFDVSGFRPLVDRVVEKLGDMRVLPVVEQYAQALRQRSPEEAAAFEATLQSNPAVATAIKESGEKQKAAEAKAAADARIRAAEIGKIKFTAADGREVDLEALKGKVVLVDFWATWCGPCIAELPNVRKVYAAYHDKGFEVIGITLENSGVRSSDSPEQTAAKLDASKVKMLAFTAKNEMPWPQYYDGQHWKNVFAQKFGIGGIPAMFLLDKNGQVATADARGEKLEAEVKRLLAL